MNTYNVVNSDGVQPFFNEYEAENKLEALKMFIDEARAVVKNLKNTGFTFELDEGNLTVKEYTDGEYSGNYYAREGGREMNNMEFRYGMRSRGFAPLCQPMNGLLRREDDTTGRYYDVLVYNRKLGDKEIRDFQFDELVD